MFEAIDQVKPGKRISEIGRVIEIMANKGILMRRVLC
jgi:methionine aminopeptidase